MSSLLVMHEVFLVKVLIVILNNSSLLIDWVKAKQSTDDNSKKEMNGTFANCGISKNYYHLYDIYIGLLFQDYLVNKIQIVIALYWWK